MHNFSRSKNIISNKAVVGVYINCTVKQFKHLLISNISNTILKCNYQPICILHRAWNFNQWNIILINFIQFNCPLFYLKLVSPRVLFQDLCCFLFMLLSSNQETRSKFLIAVMQVYPTASVSVSLLLLRISKQNLPVTCYKMKISEVSEHD